jgi:4-hydroxybenzoate polyprenyltransferase
MNRWWQYQQERFPIVMHGILLLVVSLGALGFSVWQTGTGQFPNIAQIAIGFVTVFIFFFQLRVADEYKDFEEDSHYRPERPVPRGLVSLRELAILGVIGAVIQIGINFWLNVDLVDFLLIVWAYMVLMRVEFFAPKWLKAHPTVYLVSHMLIMPLIYLYLMACGALTATGQMPPEFEWFLAAAFFNGIVIEIGRKIRAPEAEQEGVDTYSSVWGMRPAVIVWLLSMMLSGVLASVALMRGAAFEAIWIFTILELVWLATAVVGWHFLRKQTASGSKMIETLSGVWALVLHIVIGLLPWVTG